jgi:hypothetical protein
MGELMIDAAGSNAPADVDVSGEGGIARDDDLFAKLAVVRHVAVPHEERASADPRRAFGSGAAMDGCELPDDAVVSHHRVARGALVLQILRIAAENRSFVDTHAAPEPETALEHRVSADARAPSDLHARDSTADVDVSRFGSDRRGRFVIPLI